ncbi:MAG: hypothetical protein AB7T27_11280 [Kiritimatiellia bacterium]
MQNRSKLIALMVLGSLLFGLLVVLIHPDYRNTARCMLRGKTEQSALWLDNENFYPEVTLIPTRMGEGEGAGYVEE